MAAAPTASPRRCAASQSDERSGRIDAARVIADLRELERRTGGPERRPAGRWGPEWAEARAFLSELLDEIGLEAETDEAGNLWAYLEGEREPVLALGSHLDSVPQGGWLDGALGVMAALGVLRSLGRERGAPAAHPGAGRLGRRGGPLRPQPARQLGRLRLARPGEVAS